MKTTDAKGLEPQIITGLTVGVYDLLHVGHINHLHTALELCESLFVGVVSDWFTEFQKGVDRPSQTLPERVRAVRAVSPRIKTFTLETLHLPDELLQVTNIVFAGPDQVHKFYAQGRNRGYGRFVVLPRTPDISTTTLLNRISGDC